MNPQLENFLNNSHVTNAGHITIQTKFNVHYNLQSLTLQTENP